MTKSEIINKLAEKTNVDKMTTEKVLAGFEELVIENLQAGKEVTLTGFGTFLAKFRSARKGVNPQRPTEKIDMPATTVPKFKAGKTLKDALKGRVIGQENIQ
jgi:DNA-binding protein HU-beta